MTNITIVDGITVEWNDEPTCTTCGADITPPARATITTLCKPCGEHAAIAARKSWCVAPLNKSNYMLFTDVSLLSQLNPKRTA